MGNLKRQTINTRIKNESEVTVSELLNSQKNIGVEIYVRTDREDAFFTNNSFERQNNIKINESVIQFGTRLSNNIQAKYNFLDSEMAQLLEISKEEYIKLKEGKIKPNLDVLNHIKQNFKVSIDRLLYGEN